MNNCLGSPIIGCVMLKPHLYQFVVKTENLDAKPNNTLIDIGRNTLISREIRFLAKEFKQLKNLNIDRSIYSKKISFQLPYADSDPDRIYFDFQATIHLNKFLHQLMLEKLSTHIVNYKALTRNPEVKYAYIDFLNTMDLDMDWETLKKAEFRMRKEKHLPNY